MHFSKEKFERIPYGGSEKVILTVTNYRLGENFEIIVSADVADPEFTDTALIMINSLEAANMGEDLKTKVTFARDLLGQNPECVELNELLQEADELIADGNFEEAKQLVQGVIDGCKYLVSKSRSKEEKPQSVEEYVKRKVLKNPNFWISAFLVFALLTVILIEAYRAVRAREREEES